jgi:hypothetical protein
VKGKIDSIKAEYSNRSQVQNKFFTGIAFVTFKS